MRTAAKRRNARGGTAVRLPGAATSFVCFIPLFDGVVVPPTKPPHCNFRSGDGSALLSHRQRSSASLKSDATQPDQSNAFAFRRRLAEERGGFEPSRNASAATRGRKYSCLRDRVAAALAKPSLMKPAWPSNGS